MEKKNTFKEVLAELEARREKAINSEKKLWSLDDVISQGYDNHVINAMKACSRGAKRFQITNNSILEWDPDLQGWTVKFQKDLGTVYFSDSGSIPEIWSNIRQMENELHFYLRDKKDEFNIC